MANDAKHRLLDVLHACSRWCVFLIILVVLFMGTLTLLVLQRTLLPKLATVAEEQLLPKKNPQELPIGSFFFASGVNPRETLERGIAFLYAGDAGKERIAHAVIRSLMLRQLTNIADPLRTLQSVSDAPFGFLLAERQGTSPAWALSISSATATTLAPMLHEAFASRFPAMELRTRTLPSGGIVRDIAPSAIPVHMSEESWGGWTIRKSTDEKTGEFFASAERGTFLVLGNDPTLLLSMLQRPSAGQETFIATRRGLDLFIANFPESDIFPYASSLLAATKDDHLSLSSWRCLP